MIKSGFCRYRLNKIHSAMDIFQEVFKVFKTFILKTTFELLLQ